MRPTIDRKPARVEGDGQFINFVEHVVVHVGQNSSRTAHALRVRIAAHGYASQSYGVIERWNGEQWKEVATLTGHALSVDLKIGYRAPKADHFRADADRLIDLAGEVLAAAA